MKKEAQTNYFMEVHIMSISKIYKNAIKAENEVVKASINENKPSNWYYGEYTENNRKYDCLTEGHVLVAFGFDTFAISKEIFEAHHMVLNINIAELLNKNAELSYKPAQLMGTELAVGSKDVFCVLQTEAGEKVFFNKKYQKYFTDDVKYMVYDSKSPIKIYNGDVFMGIIMPVYKNE